MNKYLDINYLKSLNIEPKFFRLGFIQFKINEKQRLHFYHPDLTSEMNEEEVHNHRYDFTSAILKGTLKQTFWEFIPKKHGGSVLSYTDCSVSSKASNNTIDGNLYYLGQTSYATDSVYNLLHNTLHKVEPIGRTITHVVRGEIVKEEAAVIRNKDSEFICPFGFVYPVEQLWEYIDDCINGPFYGYHKVKIQKGTIGEISKIEEELAELKDAIAQDNKIMVLCELSDLYGALEAYVENQNTTMEDVIKMSNATKRAFKDGFR